MGDHRTIPRELNISDRLQPTPTPTKLLTGRAQPPLWFRLLGVVALTAAAASLGVKRGLVVGIISGVVYGSIALSTAAAWQRATAWSKQHPLLDSLIIVPLLFLAVAYLTTLSLGLCLGIAAVAGALLVGLSAVLRRRRRT